MSRLKNIKKNDLLPEREFKPDNVELFFYNAVLWNAHRIHYDFPYATEIEGYPGLVIAGPQLGDWLTQTAIEWLADDGKLVSFEYSNRKASYIGETLRSSGKVSSVNTENGASAEIVEIPEPVGPENKPHPLDSLLLAGARQEASASRASRKPGKTWAVMTIAAVAAGAAAMAGKWVDFGSTGEPRMAVRKPLAESTSVATMEVGKTVKSPEQQQ